MRTAWLFSVVAAICFAGQAIAAQPAISTSPAPAMASVPNPEGTALDAAQIIAARPDRERYYWHDGQWWYLTAQNGWLQWNGAAWVPFVSVRTGARSEYPARIPSGGEYGVGSPAPSAAGGVAAPSYRYTINMYRAGL